jgi:hypothetical protein
MHTIHADDLFPEVRNPECTLVINERCAVRTEDGYRVIIVSGIVLAHYAVGDRMAEAHAMISLVDQGWADQNDVARVFGYSTRTVRRQQQRFADGGLCALGHGRGYPQGRRRVQTSHTRCIQQLKAQGHSNREIARRVGVSEMAIRKALRRMGWQEARVEPDLLPLKELAGANPKLSAFCAHDALSAAPSTETDDNSKGPAASSAEPTGSTIDTDPRDRRGDRLLACLGLLEDAPPLFGSGQSIPRAGVLLALPALICAGVFACAQQIYGSLGPAFYGLRTSLLTLLLMALWRIKRPEELKEHSPTELGRVLGLDRAPEVKTLRRKLACLARYRRAAQFGQALAERRVALRGSALGFLYVDGHVRVYHGKHRLPKTHVARMRLSMPATSDYWVNDVAGEPLFVVTAEANAGLLKVLPGLLAQVRALVGKRLSDDNYSSQLSAILLELPWRPPLINDRTQRRRADHVRLETKAQSRRSLK